MRSRPLLLEGVDLRTDSRSAAYIKNETVAVEFATVAGELMSREGPNRYVSGDAIVTGSTGDRWVVARVRFDAKYLAIEPTVAGADGSYRNRPLPILARQMDEPFHLARSQGGDVLQGLPGDWVVQYGPGDYGVVAQERFRSVYVAVDGQA